MKTATKILPNSLLALLLLLGSVAVTRAATKTWDGSSSGYWNLNANWVGNIKPANGDDLVFPSGPSRLITTNDFADLRLNSITFVTGTNYSLRGNGITVTNGIENSVAAINGISLAVIIAANQRFNSANALGSLYFFSNLVLNAGTTLTNACNGIIGLTGIISGSGNLLKTGTGNMAITGPDFNTFTGSTTVKSGLLELSKYSGNAITGPLIIGGTAAATVREMADYQLTSNVTVNSLGLLDLNGYNDYIGNLTLAGGDAATGAGTMGLGIGGTLTSGAQVTSTSTISGKIYFGSAAGIINVVGGLTPPGNQLVINASIDGLFGITKNGPGTLRLNSGNTYSGVTIVNNGLLQVNSPTALGSTASGTVLAGGNLEIITGLTINNEWLTNNSPNSTLEVLGAGPVTWAGNVVLNSNLNVAVLGPNPLTLSGVISGGGGIYLELGGELDLTGSAANTYTGTTTISEGSMVLAKSSGNAVTGPLVIGDGTSVTAVLAEMNNQIGNVPVTINGGVLDMQTYGVSDAIGSLTLTNGEIYTGSGTLTLGGNVTALGTCYIAGKLALGGATRVFNMPGYADGLTVAAVISDGGASAGLTDTGNGALLLYGANTYSGLTTVGGFLDLYNTAALGVSGTVASGTIVKSNGFIYPQNLAIGNEFLTLQDHSTWHGVGSGSWAGPITLTGNAWMEVDFDTDTYSLTGPISGSGGFTKDLDGTLMLTGASTNTYTGTTYVQGGTLVLNKPMFDVAIIGPLVIGLTNYAPTLGTVRLYANRQISDSAPVTINHSGLFDSNGYLETFGALSGNGNVLLPSGTLLRVNEDGSSSTFDGVISGEGSFRKDGAGTLTLNGNNTYTGPTAAFGGTLLVNGSQPQSAVSAYGTLGGSGIVGDTTVIDGKLSPGNSPGVLSCSNLLVSGSGLFRFELNGNTPGSGYDQLKINGTVNLGNQIATLIPSLGYASSLSNTFTIIDNDGTDAVTGVFNGLPEGASLNVSGIPFRISYNGGTGNDVVLTQLLPAPTLTSLRVSSTNLAFSWPTNYVGFTLVSNTNLNNTVWSAVVPVPILNGTNFVATNSMTGPQTFFRLRSP